MDAYCFICSRSTVFKLSEHDNLWHCIRCWNVVGTVRA